MQREGSRSPKKRPFSSTASSSADATPSHHPTDGEPPRRRFRPSLSSALVSTTTTTSTAVAAFDYEAAKLQSEVEDLRAALEHERSLRALDQRRAQQNQTRLERQVQFATEEASDAKSLLEDLRTESETHMEQLRAAKAQVLQQLRDCREELAEAQAQAQLVGVADQRVAREAQETLRAQLRARDEEIQQLRERLEEVVAMERSRIERTTPTKAGQDSTDEPSVSPAPTAVLRELNRVRIQLAESERQYRQLKRKADEWHNKAQLLVQQREATRSATARVQQVEQEVRELRQQYESLRATQESWVVFGKELGKVLTIESLISNDDDGPPEVATVIRHLEVFKTQAANLSDEKTHLEHQLQQTRERLTKIEEVVKEKDFEALKSVKERQKLEEKLADSEQQFQTLQAQQGIWRREADSLRSLLKTYDDILPGSAESKKAFSDAATKALQLRLTTAQEELQLLKAEQSRHQTQIESARQSHSELQAEHDRVLEKFGKLREALQAERAKAEAAEERAAQAETLAGKGSYNDSETRVLHLQRNPLADAMRERYETEIRALQRQLEEATGKKPALASGVSAASEVDPQKLHQRLKESFKEQIALFREGVYLMTGYKVDMLPRPGSDDRPTFRVRSVYAEQEQDHLMFVWPKGDDVTSLDLVETDLARQLSTTEAYQYMTKFNSLPAFLASVQLSLFEKTTFVGS